MCDHCGCSAPAPGPGHASATGPAHGHSHDGEEERRTIALHQSLLAKNDRLAEQNRGYFKGRGILALNLVSAPGAGKTAILEATLRDLRNEFRMASIVGDLATDHDAQRLRASGAPSVQVTTGTVCHLDAHMIQHALEDLGEAPIDILFIENVGNLVCPFEFRPRRAPARGGDVGHRRRGQTAKISLDFSACGRGPGEQNRSRQRGRVRSAAGVGRHPRGRAGRRNPGALRPRRNRARRLV